MYGDLPKSKIKGIRLDQKQIDNLKAAETKTGKNTSVVVRSILDHFFKGFDFKKPDGYFSDLEIIPKAKGSKTLNKKGS